MLALTQRALRGLMTIVVELCVSTEAGTAESCRNSTVASVLAGSFVVSVQQSNSEVASVYPQRLV